MKRTFQHAVAILLSAAMLMGNLTVGFADEAPDPSAAPDAAISASLQEDAGLQTPDPLPQPDTSTSDLAVPDTSVPQDSEPEADAPETDAPDAGTPEKEPAEPEVPVDENKPGNSEPAEDPEPEEEKAEVVLSSAPLSVLRAVFTAKGNREGHRVLLSGSGHNRIAVVDYDGSTIWEMPKEDVNWAEVNDADMLPNGNIVFATRMNDAPSFVRLVRPDYPNPTGYEVLWTYELPAGAENHTAQALPDGGVLIAEAYNTHVRLVELDPSGNIRKTLGTAENPLPEFGMPPNDTHSKIRQAHKTAQGTYLLTHFSKNITVELDADGALLHQYASASGFTAVKDAAGNVIVAGGDNHTLQCFAPDGSSVWSIAQNDISGVSLGFVAALNVLENGNIVFANWGGHGGASGAAVMEVNPQTKQLVWSINSGDGGSVSNVQVLDTLIDGDKVFDPNPDEEVAESSETYRSPIDAVSSILTGLVYVADYTNQSITVLRSATDQIVASIALDKTPTSLLLSADGRRLYVAMGGARGEVAVVDTGTNLVLGSVAVGHTPSAMALGDGKLYVANRFDATVQTIDLAENGDFAAEKSGAPAATTREPMGMELVNGKLYVAGHLPTGAATEPVISSEVVVMSPDTLAVEKVIKLANGSTNLKDMAVSPDGAYLYVAHAFGHYNVATTQADRGWIYTNAVSEISTATNELTATMMLDDLELGASNPWGIVATTDKLFVTISGTRELMIINRVQMRAKVDGIANGTNGIAGFLENTADIPSDLTFLTPFKMRINLGQEGPRGLTVLGGKVYTANYYSGSISVYNLNSKTQKVIELETTAQEDAVRAGERLWNDATIGFQQWQSCASCHPDARADALNWDNLNDGIGTPKQARTMLDSWERGRVMATGIRPDAKIAVRAGLKYIMFNAGFPEEEFEKLDAYVASLTPEESPMLEDGMLTESALRGKDLFEGAAGCAACHTGEIKGQDVLVYANYTQGPETRGLLVPPLREVWRTAPYLHDGSAATVKDVLTTRNVNGKHGNAKDLSDNELDDLVNYVLSLGTEKTGALYTISGSVITELEGVSLAEIDVALYREGDKAFATPVGSAKTNEQGAYSMTINTIPGNYVLRIAASPDYAAVTQAIALESGSTQVSANELVLAAPPTQKYAVVIIPSDGVAVTADKPEAAQGEMVTLTVNVTDNTKYLDTLQVTDDTSAVETTQQDEGVYTFVMPASDVAVRVNLKLHQTLAEAVAAAQSVVDAFQATNNTTEQDLANAVKAVITNPHIAVTVAAGSFVKVDATKAADGSVNATIVIALGEENTNISVQKVIDKLPDDGPGPDVDKAELNAAIQEADSKQEADYTAQSWNEFQKMLDAARLVQADKDATQAEVDKTARDLRAATASLVPEQPVVNKTELEAAIQETQGKQEADYTADSWKAFADALQKAQSLLKDDKATQQQVDAAAKALRQAAEKLEQKATLTPLEEYVANLYEDIMGRGYDAAGLAYWTKALANGDETAAGTLEFFFFGEEYEKKHTKDDQFVRDAYTAAFNRAPDAEGYAYWVNVLKTEPSRKNLLSMLAGSEEFAARCKAAGIKEVGSIEKDKTGNIKGFVTRVYEKALGRTPDAEGLSYWVEELRSMRKDPVEVTRNFFTSEEFENKNVSDAAYIGLMYGAYFNREADEAGAAFWQEEMNKGMTREAVLEHFASSGEFSRIVAGFGL